MDESGGQRTPWDLDEHLNGCLAGYQTAPSYGAAVFFALEALWGIAQDVGLRAKTGTFQEDQLDKDWTISPGATLGVPWIWVCALATAWEKYKNKGGPLGQVFGLEGGGQGKSPTISKLMQTLDELAVAQWIWLRAQETRTSGEKIRIEDLVQEAAEKFGKSDVTIRRAWQRYGRLERPRAQSRS